MPKDPSTYFFVEKAMKTTINRYALAVCSKETNITGNYKLFIPC
jgi:hypothetical protein